MPGSSRSRVRACHCRASNLIGRRQRVRRRDAQGPLGRVEKPTIGWQESSGGKASLHGGVTGEFRRRGL